MDIIDYQRLFPNYSIDELRTLQFVDTIKKSLSLIYGGEYDLIHIKCFNNIDKNFIKKQFTEEELKYIMFSVTFNYPEE